MTWKSEYLNSHSELLRDTTYVPVLKSLSLLFFSSLPSEQLINVSYLLVFLEPMWKARSSNQGGKGKGMGEARFQRSVSPSAFTNLQKRCEGTGYCLHQVLNHLQWKLEKALKNCGWISLNERYLKINSLT